MIVLAFNFRNTLSLSRSLGKFTPITLETQIHESSLAQKSPRCIGVTLGFLGSVIIDKRTDSKFTFSSFKGHLAVASTRFCHYTVLASSSLNSWIFVNASLSAIKKCNVLLFPMLTTRQNKLCLCLTKFSTNTATG